MYPVTKESSHRLRQSRKWVGSISMSLPTRPELEGSCTRTSLGMALNEVGIAEIQIYSNLCELSLVGSEQEIAVEISRGITNKLSFDMFYTYSAAHYSSKVNQETHPSSITTVSLSPEIFIPIIFSPRLSSNQPGTNRSTVQLPGGLFRVIPCAETYLFLIVPAPHPPHRAFGFAEVEKVIRLSKAALQLRTQFSATCGLRYWRFGRLVGR